MKSGKNMDHGIIQQTKGCQTTKGADGSSSTDDNMAEDIRINARSKQKKEDLLD